MYRGLNRAALAAALAFVVVTPAAAPSATDTNPLLSASTLPFGAPQFDRIKDDDYLPAIRAGMAEHLREIDAIANDPAPPTFENTFVAMERSGQTLTRALLTFAVVSQANTDATLLHVREVTAPELAAHQDAIYLNDKLFARVQSVYKRLPALNLDPESQQLVRVEYEKFVHAGANLDASDKAKLRDINKQISILQAAFQRKLLAGTAAGALVIDDKSKLAGLSENAIDAAAQAAQARHLSGKWLIALQNTTQQPALQSLNDRATRQQLFENSWTRTERGDGNDTRATIAALAQLRAEKAQLLGYPNYASYALTEEMAKTPSAVQHFLGGLIASTRARVNQDAASIQAAIDKSGAGFKLQPWDWQRYAEQVRKARFNLDDTQVRPYFELNNVLQNGLFYAANQLYGITFKERHDIPVYHPDVRVFEVFDKDGSSLALMYFDFFKRDNKAGGAWMATFVEQSKLLGTKPVVYNVENIPKAAPGQPTLLTFDNVSGIFHEFGHALNGFFANERYPSLSGTQTARDFVEYPSQFNEHWALYPAVFKHFAFHYKTGAPMPKALMDKIRRAATFDQGYSIGESLAADELDMAWHMLPANATKQDVDAFEAQAIKAAGVDFPSVPPRYRSSYFNHIWASGYAAGYYAYAWSEMLDDDTYQWFLQHGGMTRANGQRYRDLILNRGHSEDYGTMFRRFYGKDPEVGPMLKFRGLTGAGDTT